MDLFIRHPMKKRQRQNTYDFPASMTSTETPGISARRPATVFPAVPPTYIELNKQANT